MDKRTQQLMFSHKSDEWATPWELFNELDQEFGFTVDVCATSENAKCKKFYTIEQDGLAQNWDGETVWCNPPYSNIRAWVEKAATAKATTVLLLPSRTDTKWFHEFIYNKARIRFIKGRVKFGGGRYSAPFPSMLVIFTEADYEDRI